LLKELIIFGYMLRAPLEIQMTSGKTATKAQSHKETRRNLSENFVFCRLRGKSYFAHTWIGVLVTIFILASYHSGYAQNNGRLLLNGWVVATDTTPLAEAKVQLIKNEGEILEELITDKNGKFRYYLALNQTFTVKVFKEGYIAKTVELNTTLPPEANTASSFDLYEAPVWEHSLVIRIFESYNDLDLTILDKPVAKVVYNNLAKKFDIDSVHREMVRPDLKELHTNVAKQELAYKKLISIADSAYDKRDYPTALENYNKSMTIKTQQTYMVLVKGISAKIDSIESTKYDMILATADSAYRNGEYEKAKDLYNKALNLKPNEQYPQIELGKVKETLEIIALNNKYDETVIKAEELFQNGLYEEAQILYKEALTLKPEEENPQQRLDQLVVMIREQKIKMTYDSLIAVADSCYDDEEYGLARSLYKQASEIKPSEEYAQERIQKIEILIAQAKRRKEELAIIEAEKLIREVLEQAKIEAAELQESARAKKSEAELIRDKGLARKEQEAKLAIKAQHESKIRQIQAKRGESEKKIELVVKTIVPIKLQEVPVIAFNENIEGTTDEATKEQVSAEDNINAEEILEAIITKRSAEALIESQEIEAKVIVLQDKMEKESQVIKVNEMKNYFTKASSKKFFLEEIAESKRTLRQQSRQ